MAVASSWNWRIRLGRQQDRHLNAIMCPVMEEDKIPVVGRLVLVLSATMGFDGRLTYARSIEMQGSAQPRLDLGCRSSSMTTADFSIASVTGIGLVGNLLC